MTKAQERAREYALKAWHEWDEKTENQDRDGNTLYWLGETGFIEVIARAYAQGQRDLVEAARGIRRWMINLKDLAELAGVKDDNSI